MKILEKNLNTRTSKLGMYLTESDKCVDKEEENSQKLASTSLSFTNPFQSNAYGSFPRDKTSGFAQFTDCCVLDYSALKHLQSFNRSYLFSVDYSGYIFRFSDFLFIVPCLSSNASGTCLSIAWTISTYFEQEPLKQLCISISAHVVQPACLIRRGKYQGS